MSIAETNLAPEEKGRLFDLWQVADKAGLHHCSAIIDAAIIGYRKALDAKQVTAAALTEAKQVHADAAAQWRLNRKTIAKAKALGGFEPNA